MVLEPALEGGDALVGEEEAPQGGEGAGRVDFAAPLEHVAVAVVVVARGAGLGVGVGHVVGRRVPLERRPATRKRRPMSRVMSALGGGRLQARLVVAGQLAAQLARLRRWVARSLQALARLQPVGDAYRSRAFLTSFI